MADAKRWELDNRSLVAAIRSRSIRARTTLPSEPDLSVRAFRDEVLKHQKSRQTADRRSPRPGEYTGELLHMPDYPQEGGAAWWSYSWSAGMSPWSRAANEDGNVQIGQGFRENLRGRSWLESDARR